MESTSTANAAKSRSPSKLAIAIIVSLGVAMIISTWLYASLEVENKPAWVAVLALGVFLVTLVVLWLASKLIAAWNGRHKGEIAIAKPNMAIALYKDGYFARFIQQKQYELAKGESVRYIDLRHIQTACEAHTCMTSDRVKIVLHPCIVWQISNAEAYVQRSSQPDEILNQVVLAALTSAMNRRRFEQLAGNIDSLLMEACGTARATLIYYGIQLHAIRVARIELPDPSPKTDAQKEADLLTALNKVVPNTDDRTLQHAQKIIELKLASAKEATAKKD